MYLKKKHIKALQIKDFSGYSPKPGSIVSPKKHQYYIVRSVTITGDAPKDFIRYYHFGEGRKSNTESWPLFIAKLGHKHYPVESITEYLLNRVGEVIGFNIAESELAWLGGQIRFLSKYFIKNTQEQILDHGADLYAGYLNDRDFVEEIEKKHLSPDFFTVQFTMETLKHFFPDEYEELFFSPLYIFIPIIVMSSVCSYFSSWPVIQ